MTKSTITRDRLEKIKSWREIYGAGSNVMLPAEEAEELARMALAAMESEPVAWRYFKETPTNGGYWILRDYKPNCSGVEPLYRHAQPAPVVMDDEKLRALFDAWFASDCSFDQSPEASEADNIAWRESYWYVWQRCRAAMFQAGNSPVIPDAWIPVSERLPEEGGRYWCYVEEQNSLGKSHYQWNCSWNGEIWGGAMMYGRVTHWMPLPNPPKE